MRKFKIVKCPHCSRTFKKADTWCNHMITKHPNEIPEGFTPMRYLYGQITGKYKGKCMYCSNETEWNEATGKYGRICGSITCRDMYAENHQLLSPEKQREMLAKRKISSVYDFNGTELYYTGTYEYKFLEFMKNVMQWSASDIMAPSPNTYYYEYKNPNDEYHEGMRFYIPDFYIPSLNLEIEIKDQTTTHPKFLKIDKVKEDCKDKKMHELRNKVNYFKINDNDFRPFMKYLEDMKLSFSDKELLDKRLQRAASVINEVDIREGRKLLDVATEAYNGSTLTIEQAKAILTSKAKATLRIPEVEVDEKDIHIKNLYVEGLFRRIYNHYSSKSMRNVFAIEYDPASLERYKNKRITKAQLKVKEIHAPLFFALELYEIFSELGAKYNDAVYTRIANDIHSSTWLSNAEKTNVAPMNLNPLNNLTLSLLPHQRDFIMNYPKLKASLGLNGYILAFDQGLGKTLTAIALAECGQYEHVYIVCPNALMDNWALEIRKYYKKYENQKTYEKEVVLCKSRNANRNGRFFIINNEALNLMDPFIHNTKNILIVDECHNFRNIDRKRSQGLIELQSKIKPVDTLLLSGTPIKAAPSEITPSLRLIDPLMTDEAASMYTKAFKIDNTSAAGIITKRFNRAIYRKDKSVLEGLPKKVIKESFLKVSDSDKYLVKNVTRQILELYAEVYKEHCLNDAENRETLKYYVNTYGRNCEGYNEYMKWIDTHHENVMVEFHDYEKDLIRGFLKKNIYPKLKNDDEYQKLRHIEKTFINLSDYAKGIAIGQILPPARRDMFITIFDEHINTFIDSILNCDKKTIIFTQYKPVAYHISDKLEENGIENVCITGDNARQRTDLVETFKSVDTVRCMVATSDTMGVGFTLIEASQMYFFGPPWRDSDFNQCCDRIYRIGQNSDVTINIISLDTGTDLNLSTRMSGIMNWSKEMFDSAISNTDLGDIEEMISGMESVEIEQGLSDIAMESIIFNTKDGHFNFDKWGKDRDHNILWVTGFTGSGKSTTAHFMKEDGDEVIELDDFFSKGINIHEAVKNDSAELYERVKDKLDTIQSHWDNDGDPKEIVPLLDHIIDEIIDLSKDNFGKKKYIVEGIQVYDFINKDLIKGQPLLVKGTSALKSLYQRVKRDGEKASHLIKNLGNYVKWYKNANTQMHELSNFVASESFEGSHIQFIETIARNRDDEFDSSAYNKAISWMNDTHLTMIYPVDTLDELQELKNEFVSMDERQKAISDTQSKELFGKSNMEHYEELYKYLRYREDCELEEEATEGFTMPKPKCINNTFIVSHEIYNVKVDQYNHDNELIDTKEYDVPIFFISKSTIPLCYLQLPQATGIYVGKEVESLLYFTGRELCREENLNNRFTVTYKLSKDDAYPVVEELNVKDVYDEVYKIESINELECAATDIGENNIETPSDEVKYIPHYPVKVDAKPISGYYELPLQASNYKEYTLEAIKPSFKINAEKALDAFVTENESELNKIMTCFRNHTKSHLDFIRDMISKMDVERTDRGKEFINSSIYVNMNPRTVKDIEEIFDMFNQKKHDYYISSAVQEVSLKRREMFEDIFFTNLEAFKNICMKSLHNQKILFTSPYKDLIYFMDHDDFRGCGRVCNIDEDGVDDDCKVYLGSFDAVCDNEHMVDFDTIFCFGCNKDEDYIREMFSHCSKDDVAIFNITLDSHGEVNASSPIDIIMSHAMEDDKCIDMYDIDKLEGYESYCDSMDSFDIGLEGFITSNSVPINLDKLHLRPGNNVLYIVSNDLEFCKKQPILKKFNKIKYYNMDAILVGKENGHCISAIEKEIPEYVKMAMAYEKKLKSANEPFVTPSNDELLDVFDVIVKTIASNEWDTVHVVFGMTISSFYRRNYIDKPLIIDDFSYLKSRLVSAYKNTYVSDLFFDKDTSYRRVRVLSGNIKGDINIFEIKKAKGDSSDPVFYHISSDPKLKSLVPRIPTSMMFGENLKVPRVCVAKNIQECARAIISSPPEKGTQIYVYRVDLVKGVRYYKPKVSDVPDVKHTNEYWILDDVSVSLEYVMYITGSKKIASITSVNNGGYTHSQVNGLKISDPEIVKKMINGKNINAKYIANHPSQDLFII